MTLAMVANLAACGSGRAAPTITTSARSASTKTAIFRWTFPPAPDLYVQVRGPSGLVRDTARFIRARFHKIGGRTILVATTHGAAACGFHVGSVTIRIYGKKSSTGPVCNGIRSGLAGR